MYFYLIVILKSRCIFLKKLLGFLFDSNFEIKFLKFVFKKRVFTFLKKLLGFLFDSNFEINMYFFYSCAS